MYSTCHRSYLLEKIDLLEIPVEKANETRIAHYEVEIAYENGGYITLADETRHLGTGI